MEKYYRDDNFEPDKPFDPLDTLGAGKMKHCDLFDRCVDCCADCLFNNLYHLNPQPGEDPNKWQYGDLYDNEY